MIRENTIPPHKKILTTVKNEGTSPKNENLTVCHGEGKEVKARSSFPSINIPAEERKNMYVCLHSYMFFLSSAGIFILGKLLLAFTSFPSPWQTVKFSFLGEVPSFFTVVSIFLCGGIVFSRIISTYTGWSFFSFFIPNAESGNIICSTILVILSLLAAVLILIETVISDISANMPFNPGYNDNLSGAAVLAGLMEIVCPAEVKQHWTISSTLKEKLSERGRQGPVFPNTDFEFVFTGSEENGLMGAVEYRKQILQKHFDKYGKDNVYILNLDSISGKFIRFFNCEKDFAGMNRGGNDKFIAELETFIKEKSFSGSELLKYFSKEEIKKYFIGEGANLKLNLIRSNVPIKACTDMSSLVSLFDKTINIVTLVSRETDDRDDIGMPRDYHSLTDTYEKMVEENNGYNMTPVVFTVFALNSIVRYLDEK